MKLHNTGWDKKFSNLFTIEIENQNEQHFYATVDKDFITFGENDEVLAQHFKLELDARNAVWKKYEQEFGKIK